MKFKILGVVALFLFCGSLFADKVFEELKRTEGDTVIEYEKAEEDPDKDKNGWTVFQFGFWRTLQLFPKYYSIAGTSWAFVQNENRKILGFGWGGSAFYDESYGSLLYLVSFVKECWGTQVGTVNMADEFHGVQAGIVNGCTVLYGVQSGVISIAEESGGGFQAGVINSCNGACVQIGILNYNSTAWIPLLPFFNYSSGKTEQNVQIEDRPPPFEIFSEEKPGGRKPEKIPVPVFLKRNQFY